MVTILTLTLNPAVDVCATVARIEPERKLHCSGAETSPGGGGINVARAIHRLGGQATALFPAGGSTGDLLCELLMAEGVTIVPVAVQGSTREDFAVTELDTGHQYRFVLPGPALSPAELDTCIEELLRRLEPGTFVVVSGSLPRGVDPSRLADIVTMARQRGGRVLVDTSGPALTAAAQAGVYLLKPSVNELSGHAGHRLMSDKAIVDAAKDLLGAGANHAVLVSRAAAGALLVTVDGRVLRIRPPAVHVISAIGAGDSLVGGLVLALDKGCDLAEAARQGVAAGTAATIAAGHALCHPADVARVLSDVHVAALTVAAAGNGSRAPIHHSLTSQRE